MDAFAAQKTLVTQEQMEDLNAQDLQTALRQTPGVTISRYNPVGSLQWGIFAKGNLRCMEKSLNPMG